MLQRVHFQSLASSSEIKKLTFNVLNWMVKNVKSRSYHKAGGFYEDSAFDETYENSYEQRRNRPRSSDYRNYNSRNYDNRNYDNRKKYIDRSRFGQQNFTSFNAGNNQQSFGQELTQPVFDLDNMPAVEKFFYVEHSGVTHRSLEEVEKYRESHNITVKGRNVPKPITSFTELSVPEKLKTVLTSQEFSNPTAIQSQGWPIVLSGRDMVGVSQTGSGKTLVFMLPAVIHAINQTTSNTWTESKPRVLVLAPTRELVQQIHDVSDKFVKSTGLHSSCVYGGSSKLVQRRCLNGSHICIATPGRLIDFVAEKAINLTECTYLVLDEADRMLDMGFEPQIRKIISQIRPDRQTLMWSATWPREIQNLAEEFLTDYIQVTIGSGELRANPNIEQNIYVMMEGEKDNRLVSLLQELVLENRGKVLVFAQTKKKVDYLEMFLNHNQIEAMCIHGDVSQFKRNSVLKSFRKEKSCVLIATDVAARGLDITDIDHVVNFDFPPNIEDYIHRIGRTARGDASGIAHSFFTPENSGIVGDLLSVLKAANQNIPSELLSIANSNANQRNFRENRFMPRHRNFQRQRYVGFSR